MKRFFLFALSFNKDAHVGTISGQYSHFYLFVYKLLMLSLEYIPTMVPFVIPKQSPCYSKKMSFPLSTVRRNGGP